MSPDSNYKFSFGFGYDYKIDNYKLVCIVSFETYCVSEVRVCVMGSYRWGSIPSDSYLFSCGQRSRGLLFSGALHWIATTWRGASGSTKVIVSFDIADEEIQEMQLPNCWDDKFNTEVGVLKGSLSVLGTLGEDRTDVWVMKDHGVIESWTKLFTISHQPISQYLRPIQCSSWRLIQSFKNGEVLFEVHAWKKQKKNFLVSYNPKHEKASVLEVQERTKFLKMHTLESWYDVETYVGSLVSLNSGLYLWQKQNHEDMEE